MNTKAGFGSAPKSYDNESKNVYIMPFEMGGVDLLKFFYRGIYLGEKNFSYGGKGDFTKIKGDPLKQGLAF